MMKSISLLALTTLIVTASFIATASAEEKKIIGPIAKIQFDTPAAGKVTLTVKDKKTAALEQMIVSDEVTLDKLKSKKMSEGDEVRARFETTDGAAKSVKRTAGCD